MINPREGQPSGQQPDKMRFSELLRHLQNKGVPGMTDKGSRFRMISIDSTPALGGELSLDPDGNPVYSFGQKFEEGFEGWKPGQRVRSRFLARKQTTEEGDRIQLLVADSVVGDIRHADYFTLEGLPPEDVDALGKLGVAEIDANVQVTSEGKYRVSNMFDYRAELDQINGVQELYDGDPTKLERGQVLVQGRVEDYTVNHEYPYDDANVRLRLDNDRTVDIKLSSGYLDFESGVLDILDPSFPVEGDTVQVQARFDRPRKLFGDPEPEVLAAPFCRSTHLIEPSEDRAEAYRLQREQVAQGIEGLAGEVDPQAVRDRISGLIRNNLYKKNTFDRVALTASEKRQVREIVAGKFDDEADMPLDMLGDTDISEGEELRRVYGVDVYAMSYRQFYEFSMGISRGEIKPIAKGSVDYHYRVMQDRLPQEQQEEILHKAVANLAPKVIGKNVIRRTEILVDPEDLPDRKERPYGHRVSSREMGEKIVLPGEYQPDQLADPENVTSDDTYLFEQSLKYLSHHSTESTASIFVGLTQRMLDEGNFMKTADDRKKVFSEYEIIDALEENIQQSVTYNWQDQRIEGIVNADVATQYIDQLPMFRELSLTMAEHGWKNEIATDDGTTVARRNPSSHIDKVIDLLEKVDGYLDRGQ